MMAAFDRFSNSQIKQLTVGLLALKKELTCSICLSLFKEPSAPPCQHVFCRGCILRAVEVKQKCPICKQTATRRNVLADLRVAKILEAFKQLDPDGEILSQPAVLSMAVHRDSIVSPAGKCKQQTHSNSDQTPPTAHPIMHLTDSRATPSKTTPPEPLRKRSSVRLHCMEECAADVCKDAKDGGQDTGENGAANESPREEAETYVIVRLSSDSQDWPMEVDTNSAAVPMKCNGGPPVSAGLTNAGAGAEDDDVFELAQADLPSSATATPCSQQQHLSLQQQQCRPPPARGRRPSSSKSSGRRGTADLIEEGNADSSTSFSDSRKKRKTASKVDTANPEPPAFHIDHDDDFNEGEVEREQNRNRSQWAHSVLESDSEDGFEGDDDGDDICGVCALGESTEDDPIVYCDGDGCGLAVHCSCYGIGQLPVGDWFCLRCETLRADPEVDMRCCLCTVVGPQAYKRTDDSRFVHLMCAIWVPETLIADVERMEPISNLDKIDPARAKLMCVVCGQRGGACIQCAVGPCKTAFHPMCARMGRLRMRTEDDPRSPNGVRLKAFCPKHSMNTSKRKGKPKSNSKSRKHSKEAAASSSSSHVARSRSPAPSRAIAFTRPSSAPVFLSSGLDDTLQNQLVKLSELSNGGLLDNFGSTVTHLVVGAKNKMMLKRTLKYLLAILSGAWIVTSQWLVKTLEAGHMLPEEQFEVMGDSHGLSGPRRGRLARLQRSFVSLFKSFSFYLYGHYALPNPTKEDIRRLIATGGGAVVKSVPLSKLFNLDDEHDSMLVRGGAEDPLYAALEQAQLQLYSECDTQALTEPSGADSCRSSPGPRVILLCDPQVNADEISGRLPPGVDSVRLAWLLDCISGYRILPLDPYLVVPNQ